MTAFITIKFHSIKIYELIASRRNAWAKLTSHKSYINLLFVLLRRIKALCLTLFSLNNNQSAALCRLRIAGKKCACRKQEHLL